MIVSPAHIFGGGRSYLLSRPNKNIDFLGTPLYIHNSFALKVHLALIIIEVGIIDVGLQF